MIHHSEIKNYNGSMTELAEEIGNLKYDALAEFLNLLANKIEADAEKDNARNRVKLASNLFQCADNLRESEKVIANAWQICEPYMK